MELVASLPLAVGAEALRSLNRYLEDRRVAQAWYGKDDYKTFTAKKFIKLRPSICVSHVFVVADEDCQEMISQVLGVCHRWYEQRGGECCWLPLYRTLKITSLGNSTVKPAETALSSLGTVSSLPAARLSLWGLIVMAYADGATRSLTGVLQYENGGFKAVLHARHFVLTIKRSTLTDHIIGHLEPRKCPLMAARPLDDQLWRDLLDVGHTFGGDSTFKWLLEGNIDAVEGEPNDMFPDENDVHMKKMLIDANHASVLEDRLRHAVNKCLNHLDTVDTELSKEELRLDEKKIDRLNRLEKRLDRLISQQGPIAEDQEPTEDNDAAERDRLIDARKLLISLVNCLGDMKNLMVYHYQTRRLEEDIRPDALLSAKKHKPDQLKKFIEWGLWTEPDCDATTRWLKVAIALVKVLALPIRIDVELSTYGTGETVLLAG